MDKERQMTLDYKDIYVVEDFDEAQEFHYETTNQPVEIGTAVAYDRAFVGMSGSKPASREKCRQLVCFEGIYFCNDRVRGEC